MKAQLAAGDDVNARSRYGWTALMFAAWKGHDEEVVMLLDAGADPNLISGAVPSGFETVGGTSPTTALRLAIKSKHVAIARLLMDRGAKLDPDVIALAGGIGNLSLLVNLQGRGADWNMPSSSAFNATALCSASASGDTKSVAWLLRHGANPNVIAVGQTALKEAVYHDQVEVVRHLLKHGADPNLIYDVRGSEAALFHAVTKHTDRRHYSENLEVIRLLLEHGADKNHRSLSSKSTPLEFLLVQRANGDKYIDSAPDPETRQRHLDSRAHKDAVIQLLR